MCRLLAGNALLLLVLVSALCAVSVPVSVAYASPPGVIDLRDENLRDGHLVNLSGQWEFYWGEFVDPTEFIAGLRANPQYIPVPGVWTGREWNGGTVPAYGFGTVRVRVLLPEGHDLPLAFKITRIKSAFSLYVNGQLLASMGKVAEHADGFETGHTPLMSTYIPSSSELDVVIHVANFWYMRTAIDEPIVFGDENAARNARERGIAVELFGAGAFLLMGLYHLGQWSLRRHDIAPLLFGAACLSLLFSILAGGEKFLYQFLPQGSDSIVLTVQLTGVCLGVTLFHGFIQTLFPKEYPAWVRNLTVGNGVAMSLVAILGPDVVLVGPVVLYSMLSLIPVLLHMLYVMVLALARRREGAWLVAVGMSVMVATCVNDALFERGLIETGFYISYGVLAYVFVQSFMLSVRFSRAFSELELLKETLEDKVVERTRAAETAKEEATAAAAAKGEFLANMSHELRTPLNTVIGYAELARDRVKDGSVSDYLERVHNASCFLLRLINDILDFSKIEAGKFSLVRYVFRPGNVMGRVSSMLHQQAVSKGLVFSVSVSEHVPEWVAGDDVRLEQIFVNLCSNAIKFTHEGSVRAYLDARSTDSGRIEFIGRVVDTGVGIEEDIISVIFGAFTQADNSSTRRFEGTGLGLSNVKSLVEMMGGAITVQSAPGRGSEFRFTVLLDQISEAERLDPAMRSLPTPTQAPHLKGADILVVDDNAANRDLASDLLGGYGVNVVAVASGREAIDSVRLRRYDAVLMDLLMPDMDGYETVRHIREIHPRSSLPVIALSAAALDAKQQCIEAGMDDFICKPIVTNDLLQVLARWIRKLEQGDGPAREIVDTSDWGVWEHIDPAYLALRVQHDRLLMRHQLQAFLSSTTTVERRMTAAVARADSTGLAPLLHDQKNMAAGIGARALSHAIESFQTLAADGREIPRELLATFSQLLSEARREAATLKTFVDGVEKIT
ncbi:MAG: ATP-binding protein [Aquisalimonadaceae bacterium]